MRRVLPLLLCACAAGPPGEDLPDGGIGLDAGVQLPDRPDAAGLPPADAGPPDFTRYDPEAGRSPITLSVTSRMHEIAARHDRDERVFLKAGASGTVSKNLLYCFAGPGQPQYRLELDGRDAALLPTIEHFREGRIGDRTPFDRATLAAVSGKTAGWVQSGDPSPITQEIEASNARYAFVNYGTNDMQLGSTYASALPGFYEQMSRLLDRLEGEGIVPIVSGLNPRSDSAEAARWVPTYDAVTRGMAEARQLPYISLFVASRDLPSMGLVGDGIHGNVYVDGTAQPCVFDQAGLRYNYDVRNLLSIQMLDAARRVLQVGEDPPDAEPLPPLAGDGSRARPFVIDRLPFTHAFDTRRGAALVDRWSCASQNEGGPEVYYRLALEQTTQVRAVVMVRKPVDVDVHIGDLDGNCVTRADTVAERSLPAGDHAIVVDSFVTSTGHSGEGEYLLVVHRL